MAEIKLDKGPNDYQVNGENLFLLNKNENYSTISMYNHNLEMIQTFGQENSTVPYYFSLKIDLFFVSNQYFIINETLIDEYCHGRVTIINRSNGLVEGSFVISEGFNQMQLYLDKFLITLTDNSRFLKCYNFKGDLLHNITLDEELDESYFGVINKEFFVKVKNGKFFIF